MDDCGGSQRPSHAAAHGMKSQGRYMVRSDNDLYAGLVRLHVLHHAAEGDLYGNWMIKELRCHGYEISPGTLYPMLHSLERRGYLKGSAKTKDGRTRRVYRITRLGRSALDGAKRKVKELFHELLED